jgi:hypothetical protein
MEWLEKVEAQAEDNRRQMLEMNLDLLMASSIELLTFFLVLEIMVMFNQKFSTKCTRLKRRKRHHTSDPSTYISELRDKCKTLNAPTTTESNIKVHPKTDSCGYYLNIGTPSILAVTK